jgi:hypothetical protein
MCPLDFVGTRPYAGMVIKRVGILSPVRPLSIGSLFLFIFGLKAYMLYQKPVCGLICGDDANGF